MPCRTVQRRRLLHACQNMLELHHADITAPCWPLQDLSLQQLQSLHLVGRPGLHVPTLAAMFSACRSSGLRRPVLVEVKKLASDEGRQRFLQLVRWDAGVLVLVCVRGVGGG
jgi:hypothetical protein